MTLTTFNVFVPLLVEAYTIPSIAGTMNYTTFPIMSVLTTIPANYVVDKYGIKVSVLFGSVIMLIGLWVRLLIDVNYYFALGG